MNSSCFCRSENDLTSPWAWGSIATGCWTQACSFLNTPGAGCLSSGLGVSDSESGVTRSSSWAQAAFSRLSAPEWPSNSVPSILIVVFLRASETALLGVRSDAQMCKTAMSSDLGNDRLLFLQIPVLALTVPASRVLKHPPEIVPQAPLCSFKTFFNRFS